MGEKLLRMKPSGWLALSMLSAFLLFLVFFQGAAAGGLDVAEACALRAGQPYDHEYRRLHKDEQLQLFPLTTKCNAEYDLVPPWTNPALAVLALLMVACFAMALATLFIRVKSRLRG
ncbi:PAS domain-containing protein [Pseudarthrobacter sp. NamE5]|uniref:PAS domain-containing protein n=1 Tax=Pseudarthrobacter sp. NamE5 TaxID=2576839 RepID=UPI00110BC610|nr:PAS domain-containing protein [Pseudarthrobacter sp. NamE5]TLM83227.1 PAS domain-containing protein [Pseudarthrobacter sp. NamE5]